MSLPRISRRAVFSTSRRQRGRPLVLAAPSDFGGIVQRYTRRPSTLSSLSGVQGPMLKACDTIRVPGLNSLTSFGWSFKLSDSSR